MISKEKDHRPAALKIIWDVCFVSIAVKNVGKKAAESIGNP